MAVVTQAVNGIRTYAPFEGSSERQRLTTAVPRGMIRFHTNQALAAKPVNDSIDLTMTCSLPPEYAYILAHLTFDISVDTATDWDAFCRFRIFNGAPSAPVSNEQVSSFAMNNVPNTVAGDPHRILSYSSGGIKEWYPGPIYRTKNAQGLSAILQYHNSAAAVGAAGSMNFHLGFYQFELNQAVRFPLNFPFPVGVR